MVTNGLTFCVAAFGSTSEPSGGLDDHVYVFTPPLTVNSVDSPAQIVVGSLSTKSFGAAKTISVTLNSSPFASVTEMEYVPCGRFEKIPEEFDCEIVPDKLKLP